MKIPDNLGSFKDIQERAKKAFADSDQWIDILTDAYELFLPNRNLFNEEGNGQKKTQEVFDGTGPDALQKGASKIQSNIAPIWARWATLTPSVKVMRDLKNNPEFSETALREMLEEEAEIIFDYINRSNFGTQFYEMCVDLLIGTGTIDVDEVDDDENPINFSTKPQKGLAFEEGPKGMIENHYLHRPVKYRHLERTYKGFEPDSETVENIKNKPDKEVIVTECLLFDPKEKEYHGIAWLKGAEKPSWVESFGESSPRITGRYSKTAGERRGRGPALLALPFVQTLNKAKEMGLQRAALELAGMFTGTDDGVFNPYTVTIEPGLVVPVGSNNSSNPSLARMDLGGSLDFALFSIEDLQNTIKKILFADMREPSDAVVSATQFAIEARELAERIGSAFGRLQTEVLVRVLQRVHWILKRRGLVKNIRIGGIDIDIKFTSPLARAQDSEDLMATQQAVEFVMTTGGLEAVQIAYKVEEFGEYAAELTGMASKLVRNETERAEVIQSGAAAEQAGITPNPV